MMKTQGKDRAIQHDETVSAERSLTGRRLRRLAKLAERPYVPSSDDPYTELRQIVKQHKAIVKAAIAIENMASDRVFHETGEVMKCRLPEDVALDLLDTAKRQKLKAGKLETAMRRELKKLPIYNEFLAQVFPYGVVVPAYLASEVDIRKAVKPSNLRRFCGLGIDPVTRRLERPKAGEKNHYSKEMRTRIYQAMTAMWKNSFPGGVQSKTNKYLEAWVNYVSRPVLSDNGTVAAERAEVADVASRFKRATGSNVTNRFDRATGSIGTMAGERAQIRDEAESRKRAVPPDEAAKEDRANTHDEPSGDERRRSKKTGWVKAADLFLYDLYVMWRTLEGLPAWPTYLDGVVRGVAHKTGEPVVNAPRYLTMEEAREIVGDVTTRPMQMAAE